LGVTLDLPVIGIENRQKMKSRTKQIIEQYFGRQQPENIQRAFFFWMKKPVLIQEKEEVLFQLWEELFVSTDLSTEKSYRQVEQKLKLRKTVQRHRIYLRIARIAAMFLIPVLSLMTAWLYVQNQPDADMHLVECYVPHGEVREITLPDQSTVLINSGSIIFYPENFKGKIRNVYLNGEAKFSVSPDQRKPFIVRTNDMNVEALGTVFNVSSFSNNPHTITTLIEGQVGVEVRPVEESFILNPGEQVVFDKKTGMTQLKKARLDYVLAWEKGQLVFQGASLYTIVNELERRYGVVIYLNTNGLCDDKLTVKFLYDESLDEILRTLQQIIKGFKYKIDGEKIYIY
jgi:ferric-dicitrate binding protein FerR (iron transport regulator)